MSQSQSQSDPMSELETKALILIEVLHLGAEGLFIVGEIARYYDEETGAYVKEVASVIKNTTTDLKDDINKVKELRKLSKNFLFRLTKYGAALNGVYLVGSIYIKPFFARHGSVILYIETERVEYSSPRTTEITKIEAECFLKQFYFTAIKHLIETGPSDSGFSKEEVDLMKEICRFGSDKLRISFKVMNSCDSFKCLIRELKDAESKLENIGKLKLTRGGIRIFNDSKSKIMVQVTSILVKEDDIVEGVVTLNPATEESVGYTRVRADVFNKKKVEIFVETEKSSFVLIHDLTVEPAGSKFTDTKVSALEVKTTKGPCYEFNEQDGLLEQVGKSTVNPIVEKVDHDSTNLTEKLKGVQADTGYIPISKNLVLQSDQIFST